MTTTTIASTATDKTLALYRWETAGEPRGILQILHGMREHMGRYDDFARYLTQQGFAVYGHDQLGHGKTAEQNGEYGYFGESRGAQALVRDCGRVTMEIQRKHPGVPIFLLGHSMGSFVGRLCILQSAPALSGFICMATGGSVRQVSAARVLGEACSLLFGGNRPSRTLSKMLGKHNSKGVPKEEGRTAWLSRDVSVAAAYSEDPHTRPRFTNRGFCDLFDLQMAANSSSWAPRVEPGLPILLVSGGSDPVGDYGRGVVQVFDSLKLVGVQDVKCKLYDGARHELLNELNREEIYYDLLTWMEDRL